MVLSPERWPYLSGRVALFSRTDGILRPEFTLTGLDTSESQPIVPVQLKQTSDSRNQDFENQEAGICIRIGEISIDIREGVSSEMICDVVNAVRQSC